MRANAEYLPSFMTRRKPRNQRFCTLKELNVKNLTNLDMIAIFDDKPVDQLKQELESAKYLSTLVSFGGMEDISLTLGLSLEIPAPKKVTRL
ncbi:hypothetical protein Smp_181430 [Schistosoma mansoni]|uniref:hypothetical protein n=1 Tax=Schistosoma mansoni TaxID=6183 RepID=UPI0001A61C08|nr:hypothetical protein Smp_181430 [Schistosoma mansoni]|eukprot:XP_018651009.1 hypothetical protein Smp_181430 [Schistosoma mansoni]